MAPPIFVLLLLPSAVLEERTFRFPFVVSSAWKGTVGAKLSPGLAISTAAGELRTGDIGEFKFNLLRY